MSIVHRHTVRLREVDAAGIAFFSRLFEIAHDAWEVLLAEAGHPITGLLDDPIVKFPLVRAEADFASPLRLGDEVEVRIVVERIGGSSVGVRFDLTRPGGARVATVRQVHVAVDATTFRSVSLPDAWRLALEPHRARA